MYRKAITILTSFFLAASPLTNNAIHVQEAQTPQNTFEIQYTAGDTSVEAKLRVDGTVCLGGFDAALSYDKEKYTVESCTTDNPNIITNVLPAEGEIIISMAGGENLEEPSALLDVVFTCSETAVDSDFSFELSDAYCFDESHFDVSVPSTVVEKKNFSDDDAGTTATSKSTDAQSSSVTGTTSTPVTDTTSTALPVADSDKNQFLITTKENKDTNSIELSFSVQGDVGFWTAEGSIVLDMSGLGTPAFVSCIPEALTSYDDETKTILFTIVSTSGADMTDAQEIFRYSIPITDAKPAITCAGTIKDICNQNYQDVSYSILDGSVPVKVTTASTTETKQTIATTTTASTTQTTTQTATQTGTNPSSDQSSSSQKDTTLTVTTTSTELTTTSVTKGTTTDPLTSASGTKATTTDPLTSGTKATTTDPLTSGTRATTTDPLTSGTKATTTDPLTSTSETKETTTDASTTSNVDPEQTELKLPITELSLAPGERYQIKANLTGLSYSSSDLKVAIVSSDGTVTALSKGKAIITVYDSEYHAVSFTLTVQDALVLGDVNEDSVVNASDAADILIAAAQIGAENTSSLTEMQTIAADVNDDKLINASDAAIVLIYAAYVGAGNTDAKITDFVQ